MNRHFLLATDGSPFAKKAVAYLAALFALVPDVEITVLAVAPGAPSHLNYPNPALNEIIRQERLEKIEEENLAKAQEIVQDTIAALKRAGWDEDRLHPKVQIKRGDLAYMILREARLGRYDAVILGRRGLGRLASAWMGSVSQKVVTYGQNLPVWIVSGKQWTPRILVAVDLGEPGLRVVDHVGFILARHPSAEIVLFHVVSGLIPQAKEGNLEEFELVFQKKVREEAQKFFQEAQKILLEAGIDPKQVRLKIKTSAFGPAGAIIKEARDGDYGTVVVGRRGLGGFKELLLGSVSAKVLSHLHQRSVWIVG